MTTLFISDLHLQPEKPALTQAFLSFLQTQAEDAGALYILGDLFEAWIGDDYENDLIVAVKSELRTTSKKGTKLYFMHGNRDFLIGEQFAAETGCQLLPDPHLVNLGGHPTLLMHGDTLCTEDAAYQAFRRQVRDPAWQRNLLNKPIAERLAIAQSLRATSRDETEGKAADIMDVSQAEVARVIAEHQVTRLIHGHTHRPKIHQVSAGGIMAERIVLGDWARQGWVLRVSAHSYTLDSFPIQ